MENKKIMYVIENYRTGKVISKPNEDDQRLWDKVEAMESRGYTHLVVRVCTDEEVANAK